jgi:intraflagellar transport protein 140
MDLNGRYLCVVTSKGVIKIYDVQSPTKPKQLGSAGQIFAAKAGESLLSSPDKKSLKEAKNAMSLDEIARSLGYLAPNAESTKIRRVRINSSGTMVAVLMDSVEGSLQICHPDSKLHVYDRNKGAALCYDFANRNRVPINVFWDEMDDRLLACEAQRERVSSITTTNSSPSQGVATSTKSKKNSSSNTADAQEDTNNGNGNNNNNNGSGDNSNQDNENEIEVFLLFATTENGILMQDSFPRKLPFGSMINLSVPRLYFRNALPIRKADADFDNNDDDDATETTKQSGRQVKIYSKVMRDFVGMDDVKDTEKSALLDFSLNLTLGKLDEAYRVVKAINSPSIWENMAQMCVKTKRLDVAEVCLGNMGHARGAAAVRQAKKVSGGQLEVSVGVLAIQLGLLDDAAQLFRECGRFDMLNNLYQAAGLWDKAINTATTNDRIHLKTTHYQYAKHLESIGLIDDAIEQYKLSDNATTEVPRMLFQLGRVDELGDYVLQTDDTVLLKWWASYLESIERFDKAKKYYSKAKDYLSLVRIYCFKVCSNIKSV